jgi:hypothetical protein
MRGMRRVKPVVLLGAVCTATALCLATACGSIGSDAPTGVVTAGSGPSVAPSILQMNCAQSFAARPAGKPVLKSIRLQSGRVLQVAKSGEHRPAAALFAKSALYVRAGVVVDLVMADQQGGATMGWGAPATGVKRVHIPACPARGDGKWIVWPGGFWVAKSQCVHFTVSVGARKTKVAMSVGRACA